MWALGIIIAVFGVVTAFNLAAQWRVYRGAPHRRARDVSSERRPIPAQLHDWASQLTALGYERLGEIELELPAVGLVASLTGRSARHSAWVYVDARRHATASVVPHLVEFSTQLTDGSFVETMHPVGHNAVHPGLRLQHVSTSIADADRSHHSAVGAAALHHGEPRDVETMSAFLRQDGEFRQRHALAVLRHPFMRQQVVPAAFALVVGLFVLAVAAWPDLLF